jgi:antitoxin component of MazEF toxin-antitoxin module
MSDANVIDHLTAPERFRTQTRLAEAAGVKQNTMCEKRKTNALTHEQMRRILKNAPAMGVQIGPEDFFPEFNDDAPQQDEAAA